MARRVTKTFTPWKRVELPDEHMAFAERRIGYLEGAAFMHSIRYLLACAYLQGINDCVQAHVNNPALASEQTPPPFPATKKSPADSQ